MAHNKNPYVTSNMLTIPNLQGGAPGAQISPTGGVPWPAKAGEGLVSGGPAHRPRLTTDGCGDVRVQLTRWNDGW